MSNYYNYVVPFSALVAILFFLYALFKLPSSFRIAPVAVAASVAALSKNKGVR